MAFGKYASLDLKVYSATSGTCLASVSFESYLPLDWNGGLRELRDVTVPQVIAALSLSACPRIRQLGKRFANKVDMLVSDELLIYELALLCQLINLDLNPL